MAKVIEGQRKPAKRPACSAAPSPSSQALSHWNPPNRPFLSKARAPRLGCAYVSAASPPVAHVPRRALPRAPPSARVRLAAPSFLSRACPPVRAPNAVLSVVVSAPE